MAVVGMCLWCCGQCLFCPLLNPILPPLSQVHSEVDGWARVIRMSDNRTGLIPSWAVALE